MRTIKVLTAFVILLHFIGVTQLASSYSKNTSSFIGMMSQTEEETKKEKDDKEEDVEVKDLKAGHSYQVAGYLFSKYSLSCIRASEHIEYQHITSFFAPPPNHLG